MKLEKINPLIVNIAVNKTAKQDLAPFSFGKRTVKHYELERIDSSYGTIVLDGKTHSLKENDVFLRKPGQTVEGFMPYRFQYLTFDIIDQDATADEFLNSIPDKVHLVGNPQVKIMFDEIQRLFLSEKEISSLLIKARILELLYILFEQATSSGYTHHIHSAIEFIHLNYEQDISADDIAKQIGISTRYLFRQFKELLSDTPISYLGQIRLEKSKALLLDTNLAVAEIALRCGFRSASYFDFAFKSQTGISPRDFRKRHIIP